MLDEAWHILYSNPEASRFFRKAPDRLLGGTPWGLWPAEVRNEIERQHQRALNERTPVELAPCLADGADERFELRAFSCDLGMICYYRETTTSELQERLAAIVESSDDAIIGKDLNGVIRTWNRSAERIFGYQAAEVVGKHVSILAPADARDEIPAILARIARGERVDHYETRRRTKDGRVLNVSLTVSPVRDASGAIVGASKVARDITERKRQEQALREANEALVEANADLQQIAYSASHDLQEPLRMVTTYSEMLKKKFGGKLGPNGDEYIGYTVQGALRMERLLSDLRTFARASATDEMPPGEIDAGRMLDRALANLEAAIRGSDASVSRSALPLVPMHEFQLLQVFQNLIGNSLRYRASDPPRIHVAAERLGNEWQFSVQDNGIGINPQYKEQIFGIFKRLHSAAEYPGTGMGLAICKRIVERAGGRIWVESAPGRGSTFYFTVPCGETRRPGFRPEGRIDSPG